jgi:hypothetical protein
VRPFVRKFLGLPNRGGILTIVNCLFWLWFVWCAEQPGSGSWSSHQWFQWLSMVAVLVFSAPLLCPVTFLMNWGHDIQGLILDATVVGINAFIWGYSLSAFWAAHLRRRERRHVLAQLATGHCPRCGYDIRATRERCPECGTILSLNPFLEEAVARLESMR